MQCVKNIINRIEGKIALIIKKVKVYERVDTGYGDVAMGNSVQPLNFNAGHPRDIIKVCHWVVAPLPRPRVHVT